MDNELEPLRREIQEAIDICESNLNPYFTDFTESDYINLFNKYIENHENYLLIVDVEPHIRALLFTNDKMGKHCHKFAFIDGLKWDYITENAFLGISIIGLPCYVDSKFHMDIYHKYSAEHPEWHLKPYYNSLIQLLFHIHHCQVKGTCEEILLKAGLDAHAREFFYIDKTVKKPSTPSEIFDFVPLRVLKALNTDKGAELLTYFNKRELLTRINKIYPDWFNHVLTEYECEHLKCLMDNCIKYEEENGGIELPLSEVKKCNKKGKKMDSLFDVGIKQLLSKSLSYRDMMLWKLKNYKSYSATLKRYLNKPSSINERMYSGLDIYLIKKHKYYSKLFRIRRRDESKYCEEFDGYIVSFPKTVDDYCVEAIHQNNCLFSYIDWFATGFTTILFMRKKESPNVPYITFEIWRGELMQAYYKNDEDLSKEDADWLKAYCIRHNIINDFHFNKQLDRA